MNFKEPQEVSHSLISFTNHSLLVGQVFGQEDWRIEGDGKVEEPTVSVLSEDSWSKVLWFGFMVIMIAVVVCMIYICRSALEDTDEVNTTNEINS